MVVVGVVEAPEAEAVLVFDAWELVGEDCWDARIEPDAVPDGEFDCTTKLDDC